MAKVHSWSVVRTNLTAEAVSKCRRQGLLERKGKHKLLSISDPMRIRWDMCIMGLAVYNSVLVPYSLSFIPEIQKVLIISLIDSVVDLLFIIDIFLNF